MLAHPSLRLDDRLQLRRIQLLRKTLFRPMRVLVQRSTGSGRLGVGETGSDADQAAEMVLVALPNVVDGRTGLN